MLQLKPCAPRRSGASPECCQSPRERQPAPAARKLQQRDYRSHAQLGRASDSAGAGARSATDLRPRKCSAAELEPAQCLAAGGAGVSRVPPAKTGLLPPPPGPGGGLPCWGRCRRAWTSGRRSHRRVRDRAHAAGRPLRWGSWGGGSRRASPARAPRGAAPGASRQQLPGARIRGLKRRARRPCDTSTRITPTAEWPAKLPSRRRGPRAARRAPCFRPPARTTRGLLSAFRAARARGGEAQNSCSTRITPGTCTHSYPFSIPPSTFGIRRSLLA